ncbi:DinB family protein [Robiginitalea marina]|uniref:DUF1572 domain-containing protein n=1 Tax=Robiginitalea marina TaxID=2954105 RepID=A0ABT1AUI2_9FLAO|nr:DinB family protein [Robiginitalea marina]MCO5723564.1 DUF1572 domain-containing protein [Robiginitalea marina]
MAQVFRSEAIYRMEESVRMIRICLGTLDDAGFWHRPNEASNAVGQLLSHLSGNIRQYLLSGLGGLPDTRVRQREFDFPAPEGRQQVEERFFGVAREAIALISIVPEADLLQKRRVQGFELTGLGMVLHVVEHLSYHTGQIAYLTKVLKNRDLGFYDGIDLNIHND